MSEIRKDVIRSGMEITGERMFWILADSWFEIKMYILLYVVNIVFKFYLSIQSVIQWESWYI